MIEFGGINIGNPWHGKWKHIPLTNGQLTSPDGYIVDYPHDKLPVNGAVFLLKIDDLPEVETTPAESAAGKTWQNYALISGSNRCFYGKELPAYHHIYIDDDNVPWLVRCYPVGSRAAGKVTISVWIKRFGLVGTTVAEWDVLADFEVSFATTPAYVAGGSSGAAVIDIAKNGRKVLIGVYRGTGYAAIVEVTFSGSPDLANFSASGALRWDEAGIDSWPADMTYDETPAYLGFFREFNWGVAPPTLDPPSSPGFYAYESGNYAFNGSSWANSDTRSLHVLSAPPSTSGGIVDDSYLGYHTYASEVSRSKTITYIAGARYNAANSAELAVVSLEYSYSMTLTATPGAPITDLLGATPQSPTLTFDGDATETAIVRVTIGEAQSVFESRVETDCSGSGTYYYASPGFFGSCDYTATATTSAGAAGGASYSADSMSALNIVNGSVRKMGNTPSPFRTFAQSNSVFCANARPVSAPGMSFSTTLQGIGNSIGKHGSIAGAVVGADGAVPIYASEHPVTHEIVRDTVPVCFV